MDRVHHMCSNPADVQYALTLTAVTTLDAEFLYDILEVTMRGYVEATWGKWDSAQARASTDDAIARGGVFLVRQENEVVGTISVYEEPTHIQLDRLYIAPAHQRRGLGTQLLREQIGRARARGKPLRLRVLGVNPAKALYLREGFVVTETTPEFCYMEHR